MNNRVLFILYVLVCSFCILFISSVTVFAQAERSSDPDYIFYKGNTLYEEGKYDEAIREYSTLHGQGLESGNLYYNIGNCYIKKGNIGRAILNYERAKKLIPGDSDLVSNYTYARSRIKGDISSASTPWFKRISDIFDIFTINGLTIFLSILFVCTVFFVILGLFVHPLKRYYRFVLPVLLILFMLGASSLYSRVSMLGKEVVIISEKADARFEPIDTATTHFTVYEGMKVLVIESKKDWSKVERFDGKAGWIISGSMEKI